MSHFQDRHPDIDLRISAKEHLVDFARDDIDVAIRFGRGDWPGVRAEWMADEALTAVCSPALLGELRNCAVPTTSPTPPCCTRTCCRWARSPPGRTRGRRRRRSRRVARAAVQPYAPDAAGGHGRRGVALGQTLIVAGDVAADRLVAPFPFRLPTGCSYYIVSLPAAADRPKVIAFRKWVMEELNGPNGSREVAADERSRRP